MKQRVFVIFDHDIIGYPPTLTLFNLLLRQGKEVIFIGTYSDPEGKAIFEEKGVIFYDMKFKTSFHIKNPLLRKISIALDIFINKKRFYKIVNSIEFRASDLIWFIFSNAAVYSYDFLKKHNYIVQFYEYVDADFGGKYKYLFPSYDSRTFLQNAQRVVHCEYNRACIMNGFYGVKGKIDVLPNKPVIEELSLNGITDNDILQLYYKVENKLKEKNAILYQGVFNSEERRLEEFCESVKLLPESFVFMAMGGGRDFEELKKKYNSDRYVFIPFIKPPFHLLFTQLATIGVLNYLPVRGTIADVINPLYCAPNKVFEYTKFAKPILCNDIPGLRIIVDSFNNGTVIENPITPKSVADAVLRIVENYDAYSYGAKSYYDSVDMEQRLKEILSV